MMVSWCRDAAGAYLSLKRARFQQFIPVSGAFGADAVDARAGGHRCAGDIVIDAAFCDRHSASIFGTVTWPTKPTCEPRRPRAMCRTIETVSKS